MLRNFENIGHKISQFFGEPGNGEDRVKTIEFENLCSGSSIGKVLCYKSYDVNSGLFFSNNSVGFILEAIPFVGADLSDQIEIGNIYEEILEEGESIQCLLLADHRINDILEYWKSPRNNRKDVLEEMAKKRCEYFLKESKILPRNLRFIFSYSMSFDESKSTDKLKDLQDKREQILKSLKATTYCFEWTVKEFMTTVGGLINFSLSKEKEKRKWNPCQSLSSQLSTGASLHVSDKYLSWSTDKNVALKTYRVVDYPTTWSLGAMQHLIGDYYRDSYRLNTPYFIHYGVHCPNQSKEESSFWRRSQMIENQGKSGFLIRMIPKLKDELQECDYIRHAISGGAKFVWTQLSVGFWEVPEKLGESEQALKSLFRVNGFSLCENRCVHLPQYLSILPLAWGDYSKDLKELDVLKNTITSECGNFMPIQGEWVGTQSPGMLMIGRRGQILNWNPFDNQSGNYNISVVGRSGSGKSVFMQELLLSGLGTGARVFVIDVGRSFEKMCECVEGQFIEFSQHSDICLNPFTVIKEDDPDKETSISFLKSIIGTMAAPTDGTNDYQNSLIEKGINHAWNTKKNKATITDVADYLLAHEDRIARHIGTMLTPYTKEGVYARYFEGENNVNFNNPMVLIELEELKEKKDLQAVVLQLFIMTITNQTFLGDRKTPFYICIDEAWDLLRAKQTGSFIETLARRLRKYNGSLVVGTQSVDDFFATPGAKAAFDNSDWMCLLSQKQSSIRHLSSSGKFELDEGKLTILESIKTVHGEYSEVMIMDGNSQVSVVRLMLDPFSQLLYSTKASDYSELKTLTNAGLTVAEAINRQLVSGGVSV